MRTRSIEIFIGVVFSVVTIYLVIFSPISLIHHYSTPIPSHPGYTVPGGDGLGWLFGPLIVVFCFMCAPIITLVRDGVGKKNSDPEKNEYDWYSLTVLSIMYAIGVFLLYAFS